MENGQITYNLSLPHCHTQTYTVKHTHSKSGGWGGECNVQTDHNVPHNDRYTLRNLLLHVLHLLPELFFLHPIHPHHLPLPCTSPRQFLSPVWGANIGDDCKVGWTGGQDVSLIIAPSTPGNLPPAQMPPQRSAPRMDGWRDGWRLTTSSSSTGMLWILPQMDTIACSANRLILPPLFLCCLLLRSPLLRCRMCCAESQLLPATVCIHAYACVCCSDDAAGSHAAAFLLFPPQQGHISSFNI